MSKRKNKNFFDIGLNLLILFLFLSNLYLINLLDSENFIKLFDFNIILYKNYILGLIFFVQSIIIITIIKNSYQNPINELMVVINDFMYGNTKGQKINIKKDYANPNIKFVIDFFNYILNSLKNIKDEFLSGKAVKGEVQLATELQEKLLNKKLDKIPSLDVIAKSKPAGEIGGDSYDIIKQDENYYIYVGDATGHGVGAGFVMVMVNALVSGFSKIFKSSAQILAHTNEILKPRIKSNILMTVLMIRWNEVEKRLFMTGAGHEYLIIYKYAQKKCFLVKSGGIALGMTKNIHSILKEQEIKFEQNDIVVLYSDGITESINQSKKDGNEQMFGEQRLLKIVESSPSIIGTGIKTARGVFNNITIELSKFMGYKHKQLDDITLVVVHYKGDKIIENDFGEQIQKQFITERNWN